jgi:hypothetical protein
VPRDPAARGAARRVLGHRSTAGTWSRATARPRRCSST